MRQVITRKGIEWPFHRNPAPETFLGDLAWRDFEVTVDARLDGEGFISLFGRVGSVPQDENLPQAYWFRVSSHGTWELGHAGRPLASGELAFGPRRWHKLGLRFRANTITTLFEDQSLGTIQDDRHASGMIGLGTGWHAAEFDNLRITPLVDSAARLP